MPIILECFECQKPFSAKPKKATQATYFCSINCKKSYQKRNPPRTSVKVEITCSECQTVFFVVPSTKTAKFCSRKCKHKNHKNNLALSGENSHSWKGGCREDIRCKQCGDTKFVQKDFNQQFCSKECYFEWKRANPRASELDPRFNRSTVKCAICEKEQIVTVSRMKRYLCCSKKCYKEWQKQNAPKGPDAFNWNGGAIVKCEMCETEFKVNKAAADERRFCSKQCDANWRSQAFRGEVIRIRQGANNSDILRWSRQVKKRDNRTCQKCGTTEGIMHAHHIKPVSLFPEHMLDLDNGITLCAECHRDIHKEIGSIRSGLTRFNFSDPLAAFKT